MAIRNARSSRRSTLPAKCTSPYAGHFRCICDTGSLRVFAQPTTGILYVLFLYVLFCEQVWAVIISGCPLIGLPPSSPSFPLSPSFRTLVSQKLTRREVARHSPDGSSPVVTISWTFSAPPRLRVSPSPLQGSKGLVKAASKRGKEIEPELRCADFFQGTISNSSHRVE